MALDRREKSPVFEPREQFRSYALGRFFARERAV
jgi:hypothetical protein